jgi:hypothetical protein
VPRTAKPQISFADWELLQQGISLDPLLQSICDFLDDHEEMIEAVRPGGGSYCLPQARTFSCSTRLCVKALCTVCAMSSGSTG